MTDPAYDSAMNVDVRATQLYTLYAAQDNGITGRIAAMDESGFVKLFRDVPSIKSVKPTKKAGQESRIDWRALSELYKELNASCEGRLRLVVERPFTASRWVGTIISGNRAWEATLIAAEHAGVVIAKRVDSREWQKHMLPKGFMDTKQASRDVGLRLYPQFKDMIAPTITRGKNKGQDSEAEDADALLMAECARRLRW